MQKYIDTVNEVEEKLKNKKWVSRYNQYAKNLLQKEDVKLFNYIRVPKSLVACTSLTKDSYVFDLRFNGDNVAKITINQKNEKKLELVKSKKADEYFEGFKTFEGKVDWSSQEAYEFRKHFKKISNFPIKEDFETKSKFPRKEHAIELFLKQVFAKNNKTDAIFRGIKPVSLFNLPFQMPTPITASDVKNNKIAYSEKHGGGIDILCRVGKGKNTRLTVMELKDKQTASEQKKESPDQVMKQAICYATFIRELIRNDECNGLFWWNFFGFKGERPKELTINTVVAIPKTGQEMDKSFANKKIYFENPKDCLELHYFYYNYDNLNEKVDTSLRNYDEIR